MERPQLDLGALFETLDVERRRAELSWAALGQRIGVAPSTLRRFAKADDAEADGVLAAIRWLDVAPESYVCGARVRGARLTPSGDGQVRVDMAALAAAIGQTRGPGTRTRTTIQTLVAAADGSRRSIASLTRLADA